LYKSLSIIKKIQAFSFLFFYNLTFRWTDGEPAAPRYKTADFVACCDLTFLFAPNIQKMLLRFFMGDPCS